MTHQAQTILDALLLDCQADPSVTREKAIAALIMMTRKAGLGVEDFREMNYAMRTHFGTSRVIWEATTAALLESIPGVSGGYAEDLSRQN